MSVFVDFLFGSSTETVPSTSFQGEQQGQEIVSGESTGGSHNQDEGTATTSISDGNNHNDVTSMSSSSSSDTEYGDLLEGMVVGLLQVQSQENHNIDVDGDDDDIGADDGDSASYFDGRTIVSSAPSEITIGADPYPLEGQRTVARVPSSAAISLSTASSCFLNVEADETMDAASAAPSVAASAPDDALLRQGPLMERSLSFMTTVSRTMQMEDTTIDPTDSTDRTDDLSQAIRDFTSSQMVQHHAAMAPSQSRAMVLRGSNVNNTRTNSNNNTIWYAHFTDDDWDAFRQRALTAMRCLFSPPVPRNRPTVRSYQLPPLLPALVCQDSNTAVTETDGTNAQKAAACGLPHCFLCPLCQDVMVGAITLDCGCQANVCAACWEYRCATQRGVQGQQLALDWGYIIIPTLSLRSPAMATTICPKCYEPVDDPLGCHALDVAISQVMVQNVHAPKFRSLWESYVQRVEYWRDELVRRQLEDATTSSSLSSTFEEEQQMAELIEEEESFWKRRQQQQEQRRRARACALPGWLGMAVAAAASVGMKLLLAQHLRAIQNSRS